MKVGWMAATRKEPELEPDMKTTTILVSALLAAGATETVNFDKAEAGKPPSGWTATQTGTGQARWTVTKTTRRRASRMC